MQLYFCKQRLSLYQIELTEVGFIKQEKAFTCNLCVNWYDYIIENLFRAINFASATTNSHKNDLFLGLAFNLLLSQKTSLLQVHSFLFLSSPQNNSTLRWKIHSVNGFISLLASAKLLCLIL